MARKSKGDKMNQIAQRITGTPAAGIKDMAGRIAREAPQLADLNAEQLEQIARIVITQRLTQELDTAASLAAIDYESEKAVFLANAGKTKSKHTATAYRAGLDRLEKWTATQGINILELTPKNADDFIYFLNRDNRAPASIRLDTAAASSFYSFLTRRHKAIGKNVFLGTKARPDKKAVKEIEIPTLPEVETIIAELPAELPAAVSIMAFRGLRCGALPTLSITGGKFTGRSKGKDIKGDFPAAVLEAIRKAGLPLRGPFAGVKANTLEQRIIRGIAKLHKAGKVTACYSAHDLRHFYAISEYRKNKDIHALKELLNHASILVTENYLKSRGEIK